MSLEAMPFYLELCPLKKCPYIMYYAILSVAMPIAMPIASRSPVIWNYVLVSWTIQLYLELYP